GQRLVTPNRRQRTTPRATRSPRSPQGTSQRQRFAAIQRYGLGCRRQSTRAPAATTRGQFAPGLGSKQGSRKSSARGRVGYEVHAPPAGRREVVGAMPANRARLQSLV